jgi:site-specific recombinase XerD
MSEVKTVHIPSFPALVQQFFTDYLLAQRAVSPNTIASYRDARLLFLEFAHERLGKWPTELTLADLEPDLILAFLDDLERRRNNSVRRRNLRLTALRAFLKFAGRRDVASLLNVERALGVPMKRFERPLLGFLSREEMFAVIGQPGTAWTSQRDHLLLTMLYSNGARVSEIVAVRVADVVPDTSACVHLHGKGRKQRAVPLWKSTAQEVRAWLRCNPALAGQAPLLPNRDGRAMTRRNVNERLDVAVSRAAQTYPSLTQRRISPHTSFNGHASAAVRRRLQRHCTVAGPRERHDYTSIRGGGSDDEGAGPGAAGGARSSGPALPTTRRAESVPRGPMTM